MDGAKPITDTQDHAIACVVDWCIARTEACARAFVDLVITRILVIVGMKQSENLCHRKGKGSLTM